jgi:hypothetical protein
MRMAFSTEPELQAGQRHDREPERRQEPGPDAPGPHRLITPARILEKACGLAPHDEACAPGGTSELSRRRIGRPDVAKAENLSAT